MPKILSVVADLNHITHPLQKPDQLRKPTLADRIFGIVCLVLSVPLTLGILTGLYFYWANRKVALIDKSNAQKVDQVVNQIFGKTVAKPPESTLVANAARNLLSGKKEQAGKYLESLATDGRLTPQVKEALLDMVVTNNQVDMLEELKNRFVDDTFLIEKFPLHKARSGKMVDKLVEIGVPVDFPDENGRTALHQASSVEVAKALVKNKSEFFKNRDKDGLMPLNTVTSPEVLKAILSKANEVYEVPSESRQQKMNQEFYGAFKTSFSAFFLILENQPDRAADIDNLRNNIKALLSCLSREALETDSSIAIDVMKSGSPELLKVFIDKGGAVNPPDENLLAGALFDLNYLISKDFPPDRIANAREVVDILIDKGAEVNRDIKKGDCLKFCLEIGDPTLLQKLIDKHVVLTQEEGKISHLEEIMYKLRDKLSDARDNNSPQLEKQIDDLCACVPILLDAGVTVKLEEQYRFVADSISLPHTVIKALVTKGFVLNEEGRVPLVILALEKCVALRSNAKLAPEDKKTKVDNVKEIINVLIDGGARVPPDSLYTAVETGDPDLVRLLLEKVPVDGGGIYSNTPLQNALFSLRNGVENKMSGALNMDQEIEERSEIVRLLVAGGASMEQDLLHYLQGLTGVDDVVQLLKDRGATR